MVSEARVTFTIDHVYTCCKRKTPPLKQPPLSLRFTPCRLGGFVPGMLKKATNVVSCMFLKRTLKRQGKLTGMLSVIILIHHTESCRMPRVLKRFQK